MKFVEKNMPDTQDARRPMADATSPTGKIHQLSKKIYYFCTNNEIVIYFSI